MIKSLLMSAAIASAFALGGCNTPQDRAVGGALIGAGTGALVGNAVAGRGNRGAGTAIGAVVGAAGGAMVGAATAPSRGCAQYGYDYYGNYVCTAYY